MAGKNVTYVVFLNARKAGLHWSLEVAFANYRSFCQLYFFSKFKHIPQVRSKIELSPSLPPPPQKNVRCECDVSQRLYWCNFGFGG